MYRSSCLASHWSGGIPRRPGPATGSTQPRLWSLNVRTREDRDLPLGEPSGVIPGLGTGFSNGFKYAPLFSGTLSQSSGRALLALLLPAPQPCVTGVRHGPSSKCGMYIVVRWATRVSAALQFSFPFYLFLHIQKPPGACSYNLELTELELRWPQLQVPTDVRSWESQRCSLQSAPGWCLTYG